jgi:hypothetical protein
MGDKNNGHFIFILDRLQGDDNSGARVAVKRRKRLIEDQAARPPGNAAGNGESLQLASRNRFWKCSGAIRQGAFGLKNPSITMRLVDDIVETFARSPRSRLTDDFVKPFLGECVSPQVTPNSGMLPTTGESDGGLVEAAAVLKNNIDKIYSEYMAQEWDGKAKTLKTARATLRASNPSKVNGFCNALVDAAKTLRLNPEKEKIVNAVLPDLGRSRNFYMAFKNAFDCKRL